MTDPQVNQAVTSLLSDPCPELKDRALLAVEQASDSDRRMAITQIETFLYQHPEPRYRPVVDALIALRRAGV